MFEDSTKLRINPSQPNKVLPSLLNRTHLVLLLSRAASPMGHGDPEVLTDWWLLETKCLDSDEDWRWNTSVGFSQYKHMISCRQTSRWKNLWFWCEIHSKQFYQALFNRIKKLRNCILRWNINWWHLQNTYNKPTFKFVSDMSISDVDCAYNPSFGTLANFHTFSSSSSFCLELLRFLVFPFQWHLPCSFSFLIIILVLKCRW